MGSADRKEQQNGPVKAETKSLAKSKGLISSITGGIANVFSSALSDYNAYKENMELENQDDEYDIDLYGSLDNMRILARNDIII